MLITVGCPSCGHRYDIPGRLAGKKVRCKECSTDFRVPVPATMPVVAEETRKRKPKTEKVGLEGSLSGILDSAAVEIASPPATLYTSQPLIPDLGERWTYRGFQLLCFMVLGVGCALEWIVPFRVLIWFCILMGIFLLLPIFGGWESFETSRVGRILGRLFGSEGAKAVQATFAVAFWMLAILVGMGTIHIEALDAPPQAKAVIEHE